jgi:uncharacterized protein involved in outer membrane biogenesis
MKRVTKWLLLLIAVLAVIATVLLFNPGLFKGPIERYLGNLTGHSIILGGDLDIDIGGLTELTVTDIQVSAPDWASQADLVKIGQLKLSIVISSVFEDTVILESLQLDGLQLNLESDTEGNGNWQPRDSVPDTSPAMDDKESQGKRLVIKDIGITNTAIHVQNGKTDANHLLRIDSFKQSQLTDGMFQTALKGQFNGRLVEYSGKFGPYENLLDGQNISFDAKGHFGDLKISGSGLVDDLLKPRQPTFIINLEGPDIDEITAMFDVDDLGAGGFSLRAKGGQIEGHYGAGINGKIGDIALDFSAQATDLSKLDELDMSLSVNGPSLGAFIRAFGIQHWPDKPFNIKADVDKVGGTLNVSDFSLNIGGTNLALDALLTNFPNLDASRIKLKISGDDITQFHELLGFSGLATGAFEVNGKLDVSAAGVELVQVDLETSMGRATLSGTLGEPPSYNGSQLNLHLDGENAHTLISSFGIDALPDQPFNLNTRVELIENGIRVERGVLVTIENERLELGGLITFNPGIEGTDLDLKVSGDNLAQVLRRLVGTTKIPDRPYELSGKFKVVKDGLTLSGARARFEGIALEANGLVTFEDQLLGSRLDFDIRHENFSELANFEAIGDSLDFLVPGQAFQSSGHLTFEKDGWKLNKVNGRLGKTDLGFDVLISNREGLVGSDIQFSLNGPDLRELLIEKTESSLPPGAFKANGQVQLSDKTLFIKQLIIDIPDTHGKVDLELGWPMGDAINVGFNINIQGNDIRNVLPQNEFFEAEMASFTVETIGKVKGDQISLQQFGAEIGNMKIAMTGHLNEKSADSNVDIDLSVSSNDVSTLGRLSGKSLPAIPLDLKAEFFGNARKFTIRNFNGSLGASRLNASLDVSLLGSRPDITLTGKSEYFDISPFVRPDEPEEDETTEDTKQDRLIPATPLPLDVLNTADVAVNLNITELKLRQDSLKNLLVDVDVKNGALQLQELSFNAPRGKLKTSVSVQPTGSGAADLKLDLSASNFFFQKSGVAKDKLTQIPAYDIEIHTASSGSNFQEVAGSSNGYVSVKSTGGLLEGVDLSFLDSFILEDIFSLLMPKSKQPTDTQLTCAAVILNIKNGMVKTTPAMAFTTDKVTIVTKGTLDLKTEEMKFNFNATPNNALQISATELVNPYILISGTLANPAVGLDPTKTLIHGGAAIGTAGISILAKGLIDRVGNAIPLCEEMLNKPNP